MEDKKLRLLLHGGAMYTRYSQGPLQKKGDWMLTEAAALMVNLYLKEV